MGTKVTIKAPGGKKSAIGAKAPPFSVLASPQPAFDADGVECDTAGCEDLDITATLLGPWGGRLPTQKDGIGAFA